MSDYQDRLEEARRLDNDAAARRRAVRLNAGNRRRAASMDTPPVNVCIVCGVDIDLCKCESGE